MGRWIAGFAALIVVAIVVFVVLQMGGASEVPAAPASEVTAAPAPDTAPAPSNEVATVEPLQEEEAVSESIPPESTDDETPPPPPDVINEETLIDTTWGRDGFEVEFGPDGALRIGGRDRARWQIVGDRIRLYSETTDEEHWLDIEGNTISWQGQAIARTK